MNLRIASLIAATSLLSACGLSDQEKVDYTTVQRSGVSPAVYDKMMHDDPLGIDDVIALTQAHVSDAIIVRYIRAQNTVYNLTPSDFARLRNGGVSGSVVDFMVHSGYRSPDSPWGP